MCRRSSVRNKRLMVDPYSVLTDPVTSRFRASYDSGDNVHPSTVGLIAWGSEVWNQLKESVTRRISVTEVVNDGPNGMFTSGRFNTGGGNYAGSASPGLASGLGVTNTSSAFTPSLVPGDNDFNWQRFTVDGATSTAQLQVYQAIAATVAPGDVIQASVRIRSGQSLSTPVKLQAFIRTFTSSGSVERGNFPLIGSGGVSGKVDDFVSLRTFVVPALADRAQLNFIVPATSGTYDFAQPTVYNLTALGAL